jgi:hypothetical protein
VEVLGTNESLKVNACNNGKKRHKIWCKSGNPRTQKKNGGIRDKTVRFRVNLKNSSLF